MASAILLFVLALAHKLLIKDRIARAGRWEDRWLHPGLGLTGRTLGLLGAGNIGREVLRLALPFEMRRIVSDPYVTAAAAAAEEFELVGLETLFRESDFLCVLCPLTEETRGLVSAERIALMRPTAHLVSAARGPIVDEAALIEALREGRIAGAALDVFQQEPVDPANPLLSMENVIVSPHAVAHTDEFFRVSGASACRNALAIREGYAPAFVVNTEVLEHPLFLERLEQNRRAFA
jgi:D-3-phosphoglycerate dehydrogenase